MVLTAYYPRTALATTRGEAANERLRLIFSRLSTHDLNALEPLYDLCASAIYGLALWRTGSSADAADVVQTVFIRLSKNCSKLADVKNPWQYLLQTASRAAIDVVRRRRPQDISISSPEFVEPYSTDQHTVLQTGELISALGRISGRQREAIYLRYFFDFSLAEIANITGVSLFTAASRCRLGLAKLRKILEAKS